MMVASNLLAMAFTWPPKKLLGVRALLLATKGITTSSILATSRVLAPSSDATHGLCHFPASLL